MNIFYLNRNPVECAQSHVDKHVVKMVLEYAQLLSTAHRVLDKEPRNSELIYSMTHKNHPSAVWTRSSDKAYNWLYQLFCETANEYKYRYRKDHLTFVKLKEALSHLPMNIPKPINQEWIAPTPAMPDECKVEGDVLASYRKYYNLHKQNLATWTRRPPPVWFERI